ncbi:uncharacterized protein [Apostichopus japonicus]|uniref:uncharacterized protein n=1 Tax=Stichopus japonicus TaxID=307972 RepID=UPI003AB4F52E
MHRIFVDMIDGIVLSKLSDYDGIDTPDEEAELIQPKQSRDKSLKEPKLLLLANGETVRQYREVERNRDHFTAITLPRSILKKKVIDSETMKLGLPNSSREPRQDSPTTKHKNHMKNIYNRILRPGSRAEQLLIQNGENSERIFLQMRDKSADRKHGKTKLNTEVERKVIRNAERPQLQFEPERVCPCPANEHIIPAEREASKSDDVTHDDLFVYDDFEDDEPSSDETVTLIPVNRQTVRTWEVGTDKTTICYRLGTAPKSKPSETSANSPTLDLTPPPVPGRVITTPVKSPTKGILNGLPPPSPVAKIPPTSFTPEARSKLQKYPGRFSASLSVDQRKFSSRGARYIVDDKRALMSDTSASTGKAVTFDTLTSETKKRLKKRSCMRKARFNNENQLRTSELLNHLENLPMLRKFKTKDHI